MKSQAAQRRLRLPVVWDSVDCISFLFRQAARSGRQWSKRLVTRFELRRTEKYESYLLRQFRHVLISSPVDRQLLLSLLPAGDLQAPAVSVIPIGVDSGYFRPNPEVSRLPATLVISGKMSYHANVAMVSYLIEEIMPRIWARRNDVRVVVVGKDPPRKLSALGRDRRVCITGTVKDVRPYLQSATLAVAPVIYGAGMQSKLLEAMACATPVVTTPLAIRALEGEPRRHLVVAEKADDFAEAVLRLLQHSSLREMIGRSGREYVVGTYAWVRVARRLADVYAEAVSQAAG
ncbi:MAG: glycosyltransferase [Acidobacteria bacterium]|nr:glycosyltransferase [Acidobacteriota bacterium]